MKFQSTHPLRGATASVVDNLAVTVVFQSTHPLRGATCRSCRGLCDAKNFNPRTPCGVRPQFLIHIGGFLEISIHAPLAGCDLVHSKHKFGLPGISIHAPLAGCDSPSRGLAGWIVDFNPRTPCGVRRGVIGDIHIVKQFQSTHPLRGATCAGWALPVQHSISIHAPLAGCDLYLSTTCIFTHDFNPRTPCGVRQNVHLCRFARLDISIHAPLAGCDMRLPPAFLALAGISIHAPLAGCDDYQKYRKL